MNAILDDALDLAVVPGYTSLGFGLRRRSWPPLPPDALAGKSVLVTGASSGIGMAAAAGIARLGGTAHMLVRDRARGEEGRRRIAAASPEPSRSGVEARLRLWTCDLADLDAMRAFAASFGSEITRLHGLVHNAGVLSDERERSAQGVELTFAVHVLAPYVLTRLLRPALRRGAPSTVVFVSSGGMYTARLDADDPALDQRQFDGPRFYAHAKRIQVILSEELGAESNGSGVAYAAMHPGWADTPGLRRSLPRFRRLVSPLLRDAGQGADTIVWLLATNAAAASPGAFWHDRRVRPTHRLPRTRDTAEERRRLMAALDEMAAPWAPGTVPPDGRGEH